MKKTYALCAVSLVWASVSTAEDVWVLQGNAQSPIPGTILVYLWTSDVLFYNANANSATIRLVELSNGGQVADNNELTLASGRSTSMARSGPGGRPNYDAGLWVTHLDVPPGVTVESRISIGQQCTICGLPNAGIFGKVSFAAYRSLQPAGTTKIHLGTDLEYIPSRNNVAVYNAADAPAHARIEAHQLCDDALLDARDVEILAKTVIQVTGLSTVTNGCVNAGINYTYVAVTVNQPSLSWVSSLSNADPIKVVYGVTNSSP